MKLTRELAAIEALIRLLSDARECARLHDLAGLAHPEPLRRLFGTAPALTTANDSTGGGGVEIQGVAGVAAGLGGDGRQPPGGGAGTGGEE